MFVYPHENQMNIVHKGTYPSFPVFSVGWNLCIKKCYASTWMHNSCLNKDKWENHVQCVVPLQVSARKKLQCVFFFMFSSNNIA